MRTAAARDELGGLNLANVLAEAAEVGYGCDSDAEGDVCGDHDVALTESLLERMSLLEE
jgi:hypothetical protein